MANELQKLTDTQHQWLAEQGIAEDTWRALTNSLFPGANPASVQLYWHYCQARKMDPMKKPAHIVPMPVEDARTGKREWRDVIMPGIAEARITANRTGQYVGQDEADFGPEVEHQIGSMKILAPAYCTVRVHRKIGNRIGTFAHTEYFEEAVATKKDGTPNAMWRKRKRGQLSKCAEAGALRKAFPEELGGEITAEEAQEHAPIDVGHQRESGATAALSQLQPAQEPTLQPSVETQTEVIEAEADPWLADYDEAAETDDDLIGQLQDGLEEAVAGGDADNIRGRIEIANRIADENLKQDALVEIDDALTRAQGE